MVTGVELSAPENLPAARGQQYELLRLVREHDWLRTMAHAAPVAIFRSDARGICSYVNECWTELTGYPASYAIGSNWQLAIHPDDIPLIEAEWQRCFETRAPFRFEHRYLQPSGRVVWVLSQISREVDGQGRPTGYTGMTTDITELRQMREELQHSNQSLEFRMRDRVAELQRMARIVETIDDAVVSADLAGRVLSWNRGAEKIFGYTAAEMLGQPVLILASADKEEEARQFEETIRGGGEIHRFETTSLTKGGALIEVAISGFPLRDATGEIAGSWAILRDITARKRAERALRESESRYRTLHESMRDAFVCVELNGRVTSFNSSFQAMLGFSPEELRALRYEEFTPEKWHAMEAKIIAEEVLQRGYSGVYEKEYRHKDGTIFPIELRAFLIRDAGGRPSEMWAIVRDITERKRAEQALRDSEARYRLLADYTDDIVALNERDGSRSYVSPSYFRLTGWTPEEAREIDWRHRVHPEDVPVIEAARAANLAGEPTNIEYRARCRDDSWIWLEVRCKVLRDERGEVRQFLASARDITERKRAERQLQQLSRRLLSIQDEERRRIARELHDSTAQTLAALAMNLAALAREDSPLTEERRRQVLADCTGLAEMATGELRTTAYLLHPPLLDERGLPAALAWFVSGFSGRSGVEVKLEIAPDFARLPTDAETAIFRVVQECLHNVLRHSGSQTAEIRLVRDATGVVLEVRDCGSGPPAESGEMLGVGIAGMRERLLQLGGTLTIGPNNPGTAVIARLPIAP